MHGDGDDNVGGPLQQQQQQQPPPPPLLPPPPPPPRALPPRPAAHPALRARVRRSQDAPDWGTIDERSRSPSTEAMTPSTPQSDIATPSR